MNYVFSRRSIRASVRRERVRVSPARHRVQHPATAEPTTQELAHEIAGYYIITYFMYCFNLRKTISTRYYVLCHGELFKYTTDEHSELE